MADHFYAEVEQYLPFVSPVPFRKGTRYYESLLKKEDGSTNKGAFGRAVRNLTDDEFDAIWQAGFAHVLGRQERHRPVPDPPEQPIAAFSGFAEGQAAYEAEEAFDQDRKIVEQLISRPFRDKAFSSAVKDAYRDTCAITGLKIINGGGRSEVQAAHIKPVALRGPDSVRNGIALSGTVHWMFDRGLISIDEDYSVLLAKDRVPDTVERFLAGQRHLILPERQDLRPHPKFLAFHRNEIFKG